MSDPLPRLVWINTHPMTTRVFLRGQLGYLRGQGFDVTAISAPGEELQGIAEREGVRVLEVPIEREIRPWRDLVSLVRLFHTLRRLRPHIVHTGTPKASLLGMLAAWALRVPVRIYLVRGLRLETARGPKRLLLQWAERVTSACATRVLCESPSLLDVYTSRRLASRDKTMVIGPGMLNGLDAERFSRAAHAPEALEALRERLGIPDGAPVIGFVGRFVGDKGIVDLVEAFERLRGEFPTARLLLVGDFEQGDPLPDETVDQIRRHEGIVLAGYQMETAPYFSLMDVLAFPSYREGFPSTPMEAAAAEVPTVGYRATGTVDAIIDGVTGTIVPVGDQPALATALTRYLADDDLRHRHGTAARDRVCEQFQPQAMWDRLCQEYLHQLRERGLPEPHGTRPPAALAGAAKDE